MCWTSYIAICTAFVLLLFTSGPAINGILQKVADKPMAEIAGEDKPVETVKRRLAIGEVIGKCENVIILAFLILEAYTAIAIVITAKTIVRKEEIEKNSMYFLAGTLVNVSYSVLIGFILRMLLPHLCGGK